MQTSALLFFLSYAQKVGVCVPPVTLVSWAYAGKSLPLHVNCMILNKNL